MILDYSEIPEANSNSGLQDTFELFSRDFLELIGYEIIEDPSRGADDGKDLIVLEKRIGIGGVSELKWLVSCKHKAHSKRSVTQNDELDIYDRVKKNKCKGFIGFYSTIAQSTLSKKINSFEEFETQIFDKEKIEKILLSSKSGLELAKRYFPKSIKTWLKELGNNKYMKWSDDAKIISIEFSDSYWVVLLSALEDKIKTLEPRFDEIKKKGITINNIPNELRIALTAPFIMRGIIVEELHKHKVINEKGVNELGLNTLIRTGNQILKKHKKKEDGA